MALTIKKWSPETVLTEGAVAREWSRDGFTCDLWVDPPGRSWIGFVHNVDERVVVRDGRIEFEVDGERAMLGPGDEVLIPAGALHSVWNRGSMTACWYYGYRRRGSLKTEGGRACWSRTT